MNRKQRNLQYIRFKNRLRRFERAFHVTCVSNQFLESDLAAKHIQESIDSNILKLEKKYKMPLSIINQNISMLNDDFLRETKTLVVTYKRAG